jgi:radical SAM protein with 4Fe4S-binding SPASM domain
MENKEKRYSSPGKYIVLPRNDWYVFFDPANFSFTKVNEHGKTIIEAVSDRSSPKEVAARVAEKYNIDPAEIENQVSDFLANMTSTGFLHEGSYEPETAGSPDMNEAKPGSLYVHPTFNCNLHCVYCYNKKERKELGGSEMTTAEWFDCFDQAKDFNIEHIVFTGGEPLLRKDIYNLARYVNDTGMSSQLLTNGTLINDDNIRKIVSTFATVKLSLDSHIKETNDLQRGEGSYDATLRAMRLLEDHECTWSVTAVITKHNVWDISGLFKFLLEKYGNLSITPTLYIPISKDQTGLLPELNDYLEAMNRANEVAEEFFGDDRISLLDFFGVPDRQYHCGAAAGELSVAPDGSVYPCQSLLKKELNAGNVKERNLKEIFYDSPVMKTVRSCTVDNIEICRDCDVKYLCDGGCRALAYNLYGKIDSHNSYCCEYLRNVAYCKLWNCACVPIEQLKEMQGER